MDSRFKPTTEAPTLNTRQDNGQGQVLIVYEWHNQDSRIKAVDVAATLNNNAGGQEGHLVHHVSAGIPRRLTPVECERLMGWPDQHTAHGINEKGRAYDLPDTGRYKLCGNGIASPVVAWIGFQLRNALDRSSQ
jgi:site-specific DNA-cytosine methylase